MPAIALLTANGSDVPRISAVPSSGPTAEHQGAGEGDQDHHLDPALAHQVRAAPDGRAIRTCLRRARPG